jgi:peptide/nickel transport system ATP-binding protein
MLLDISELAVAYGDGKPTVEGVSLSVDAGEILAIVGESGSGKTTVIRAVLGCLPANGHICAGECWFDGKNMREYTEADWHDAHGKKISMIFQDSGNMLNPIRTIGSQFAEYIRAHTDMDKQAARQRAEEMLAKMALPSPANIMKSYPFELSGGMRQRVGIAMGITFEPLLLLADEPTSALDVTTQAQIVMQMVEICRTSGTAIIIVTHNIGVASYMADKIMVMRDGRVVEYGTAREVIDAPKKEYTKSLLASVPQIGGKCYVG